MVPLSNIFNSIFSLFSHSLIIVYITPVARGLTYECSRRGLAVRAVTVAAMGVVTTQTPTPSPHLYPQELQLKLYQAFIFSIPILFSIILVLLFYLFYLKRRASSLSSPPLHILPRNANPNSAYPFPSSPYRLDLTVQFLDKLPRILFDEDLRARDSVCCVCLGEFELKEELLQIPYCKHVFHIECIHNWLQSNSTCPLCRCSIIPTTTKFLINPPPIVSDSDPQPITSSTSPSHTIISLPPQLHVEPGASSNTAHFSRE